MCHQDDATELQPVTPTVCLARISVLNTLQAIPPSITHASRVRIHFGTVWPSAFHPGPGQTEPVGQFPLEKLESHLHTVETGAAHIWSREEAER